MTYRDTSLAAYRVIDAETCEDLRRRIRAVAESRGAYGVTADECADLLRLPLVDVARRVTDLVNAGHLVANGQRRITSAGAARVRAGKSATYARVLVVNDETKGSGQ